MAHEVVQNVVTYTVIISARNPELLLFPGMTANLVIGIDESAEVLKIPNQALRFKPEGDARAGENPDMNSGLVWVEDPKQGARPVFLQLWLRVVEIRLGDPQVRFSDDDGLIFHVYLLCCSQHVRGFSITSRLSSGQVRF
jgi:multidrug efflux pump subunit AcrA (membrane-fusion protein)